MATRDEDPETEQASNGDEESSFLQAAREVVAHRRELLDALDE